jgi:hypothetical protein
MRVVELSGKSRESECAHRPCQCPAQEDSEYCSKECEQTISETDCSCGHPDCRAQA